MTNINKEIAEEIMRGFRSILSEEIILLPPGNCFDARGKISIDSQISLSKKLDLFFPKICQFLTSIAQKAREEERERIAKVVLEKPYADKPAKERFEILQIIQNIDI